jgi:hypothetical protein
MSSYALLPNSRSDPDNIYYTANIVNNRTSTFLGINNDPPALFNENRDTPIVRDANDYNVSVMKVTINGSGKTLPIFVPQIKPGNADPIYGINAATSSGTAIGSTLTYTVGSTYGLYVGDRITIYGVTGDAEQLKFNQVGLFITELTPTVITALSASTSPTAETEITRTEGITGVILPGAAIPITGINSATCTTAGGGAGATLIYGVDDASQYSFGDVITVSGLTGSTNQLKFNQQSMFVT